MKVLRHSAIIMFRQLGTMALGHLTETTLEATMDNFNAFRKVAEDFDKLKEELHKRLYDGVDEDKKNAFFEEVAKMEKEREIEKKLEYTKMLKDSYSDIWAIYQKNINVIDSLLNKEVDVEITEVDADEFIKGVVRGKKDAPIHEIRAAFKPMFKAEEEKEADFSELDELLKDKE